jgi:predicted RNase H-like HicB family nuclease
MTQRTIYVVIATRAGEWWALEVPGVPGASSRARRLDQAEGAAREAIAVLLEIPADSFGIEVEPELEGPSGELLHVARIAREQAEFAQEEARTKTIAAVQTFAGQGMTVRDIGRLIGVSHQQAAKLLRRGERAESLSEAGSTR